MPTATYIIAVDWNNDDDFSDSSEDITSLVLQATWSHGRDYASQLTGKSIAGSLNLVVDNSDGRFNSFNTSSPLTGNLLPGRPIRVQMTVGATTTTMWTGFLDKISPRPSVNGFHVADITGIGPLGYINQRNVYVPIQSNKRTDEAVTAILDEIGWPAGDRTIATGQTTMDYFTTGGKIRALTALRKVEDTEYGFIREGKDGKIHFEDRQFRLRSDRLTSQATYSDSSSANLRYSGVDQGDPLREIFNIIEASVNRYSVGGLATLWTHPEAGTTDLFITAGATKDFWATYPSAGSTATGTAVSAWTTPVVNTDLVANSASDGSGANLNANIASLTVSKFDNAMKISITNSHASSTMYFTTFQARGTPLLIADPVKIVVEDSTSQGRYGERTYPIPGEFIPDTQSALDYCNYVRGVYASPIPVLRLSFEATKSTNLLNEARARDVSQRVTVTANNNSDLGISEDFFTERITHRVSDGGARHTLEVEVSPASGYSGFWVLGVSTLGVQTKLSY